MNKESQSQHRNFIFIMLSPIVLAAVCGCSSNQPATEVIVQEEDGSTHAIRITVEGEDDVMIEDPYIVELHALSTEFDQRRADFIRRYKSMSPEERRAYGEYRDDAAQRIRDLQETRKNFIRDKMKEVGGISFKLEGSELDKAIEGTGEYLERTQ